MQRNGTSLTLSYILRLLGRRKLPKIEASANVVSALGEMRKNDFGVLLIEPVDNEKPLVFSGYSLISRLLEKKPSDYASFLRSPCLLCCLSAGTASKESDLQSLFHVFEATTFGFAMIHDEMGKITATISVDDLLPLFAQGLLFSNLHVGDIISTPVFSMSRGSKILSCLKEMETRKFRKVKIANTSLIVSDKEIFEYLFEEERLERIAKTPQHLLDGTLEDLDAVQVDWIDPKENVPEAAKSMSKTEKGFLLSDGGILTPWDLTIKPWRLGDLRISSGA